MLTVGQAVTDSCAVRLLKEVGRFAGEARKPRVRTHSDTQRDTQRENQRENQREIVQSQQLERDLGERKTFRRRFRSFP